MSLCGAKLPRYAAHVRESRGTLLLWASTLDPRGRGPDRSAGASISCHPPPPKIELSLSLSQKGRRAVAAGSISRHQRVGAAPFSTVRCNKNNEAKKKLPKLDGSLFDGRCVGRGVGPSRWSVCIATLCRAHTHTQAQAHAHNQTNHGTRHAAAAAASPCPLGRSGRRHGAWERTPKSPESIGTLSTCTADLHRRAPGTPRTSG